MCYEEDNNLGRSCNSLFNLLYYLWFQGEYIKSGRCSGYRFLSAGMFRLLCDWSVDSSCGRNDPQGKTRSEDKDIMWC